MAIGLSTVVIAFTLMGQKSASLPPIVPQPQEYSRKTGEFEILPSTVIVASDSGLAEAEKLAALLRKSTGYPLPIRPAKPAKDFIELDLKPEMKWLGEEGYRVSVREGYVSVRAFDTTGLFYGLQSLRQLLPHEIESNKQVFMDWKVPAVEISDSPRFRWRGMHLDESRHFFGKDHVKKFIDTLALYKFNKFHWHLVDDGGWRIEIKKYPDLTRIGAWRIGDGRGYDAAQIFFNQNDGVYQVYGGFYTEEDIREVVAYALERHIEIIPEIEMPGHSLPALWVNRELACDEASVNRILPVVRTQFVNTYCPGKPATYEFLEDVLDEVVRLFPGKYVHIGGDEVDKRTWETCTDCVSLRQRERLSGVDEEYGYFMRRMGSYLKSRGRVAIGWDDVLEGGGTTNTVVMSWRGDAGAKAAVAAGDQAIMAPQQKTYFDHSYVATPMKEVYEFDPVPRGLNQAQQALILGGQGQIWTERLERWSEVEQMVFPRMLALSEALWSAPSVKDWSRFSAGVDSQNGRLDALGVESHVPEPAYDSVLVAFRDSAILPPPSGGPGLGSKFTLDGSDPTEASDDFNRPFTVKESRTVKVAFQRAGGAVGRPATVHYLKVGTPTLPLEPGLWADWYGGRFRSVEGFSGTVERTEVETWANQWRFLGDPFGVRFSGFLRIPVDGTYTFSLRSDDGSRLNFAGFELLDLSEVGVEQAGQVTVKLVKGDYPFELLYFDGGGRHELLWEVESAGFRRRSVPTEWLFRSK
jgi:hexosaminidase